MPVYSYVCQCGHKDEKFWHLECYGVPVNCQKCGRTMKKDFPAMIPAFHDIPVDTLEQDITGIPTRVHTKGQLKRLAKEHGCEVA
jgi:hypothetical protein